MTDEDFKTQKEAVIIRQSEKDKTMQQVFHRALMEIVSFEHNFTRQNDETKLLEKISKQEFQIFFE